VLPRSSSGPIRASARARDIEYRPGFVALSYGIFLPPFAEFAEPKRLVALARSAEEAGWDGFYLWDHVLEGSGMAVADSFVMASAIAQETERVRLGMLVTPLARRRPWVFARQCATLDQLSDGRLVVGVGLGHDTRGELSSFSGEVLDTAQRAVVLDESLEIVVALWSGEPVEFQGEQIAVHSPAFLPRPVQQPLPVWVACRWPNRRPLARAARHQGCFPIFEGGNSIPGLPDPEKVAVIRTELMNRGAAHGIEIVCRGESTGIGGAELGSRLAELEQAGMTWWLESFAPAQAPRELSRVVAAGPPR
jgi:alkanesulfonate monooxygenase SsuD/methylene tetrahydromethanopterin reductase-like flavin-dependent oxidoreductase (luciferase family)